ncbi:hypothetical protein ACTFIY_000341 [Dictyostelium cf. discoideum]
MESNNNGIKPNDKLFFSIWRNIFLKNNIFVQLNLLKNYKKVSMQTLENLKNQEYKKYIEKVVYYSDDNILEENILLEYDFLKTIKFMHQGFELISPSVLPIGLKKLIFPIKSNSLIHNFKDNETCSFSLFPSSVTDVRNVYAKDPIISIPLNIKRIHFRSISQKALDKSDFNFGGGFGGDSITELGFYIDESTINLNFDSIPLGLIKRLHMETMSLDFNKLPISLTHLKLDIRLEIVINNVLHFSFGKLKKLELISKQRIEIHNNMFPGSLTHLKMGSPSIRLGQKSLPSGLLFLIVTDTVERMNNNNWLPLSLKTLIIRDLPKSGWYGFQFSSLIIQHVNLPPKLVHLQFEDRGFGSGDNQILTPGCIPQSLTYLNFGSNFNQEIYKGALPNLIEINFGSRFNRYLDPGVLPINSLKKLILSTDFNKKLEIGSLPDSITHLTFGYNYNQPIISLPSSLTYLELNCPNYSHKIDIPNLFPPCLSKLVLSKNFQQNNLISRDCFYSIDKVLIETQYNFYDKNLGNKRG